MRRTARNSNHLCCEEVTSRAENTNSRPPSWPGPDRSSQVKPGHDGVGEPLVLIPRGNASVDRNEDMTMRATLMNKEHDVTVDAAAIYRQRNT